MSYELCCVQEHDTVQSVRGVPTLKKKNELAASAVRVDLATSGAHW